MITEINIYEDGRYYSWKGRLPYVRFNDHHQGWINPIKICEDHFSLLDTSLISKSDIDFFLKFLKEEKGYSSEKLLELKIEFTQWKLNNEQEVLK